MTRNTPDRRTGGTITLCEPLEPRVLLADDHPNLSQFPLATEFGFNPFTANTLFGGHGGLLEEPGDTDVFKFTIPLHAGAGVVWVLQTSSHLGELQPAVELRNQNGALLDGFEGINGAAFLGSDPPVGNGLVPFVEGTTYWLVVRAGTPGPWAGSIVGAYQISVFLDYSEGPGGGGGGSGGGGFFGGTPLNPPPPPGGCTPTVPPDDYPDAGQFGLAFRLPPLSASGDVTANGTLETPDDSDLFVFKAPAGGPTYFTLLTPQGSTLQPIIRVLDSSHQLIQTGAQPFAAAAADVAWNAVAGEDYYLIVEGLEGSGSYTVQVNAQPATHFLYYPEGFASPNISEFVALANPTPHAVTYTITARYEWGERDQIVASGTLAPWSRGGETLVTRGHPGDARVRLGVPYALEISSDGPLAASLSHYDFGVSTGESFVEQPSKSWTFAEAHKDAANFRDFLVFYNPGHQTATLTLTLYYEDHFEQVITRTVGALRRGGISFNSDGSLFREGLFAVRITSDREIVAALTSFEVSAGRGYSLLGDGLGGSTAGVVPVLSTAPGVGAYVAILNTSAQPVEVTFSWDYLDGSPGDPSRTFTIQPDARARIDAAILGVRPDKLIGLRYSSTGAVTVSAVQHQHSDADASLAATSAGTSILFGDAYANPLAQGLYHESLGLYNPGASAVSISITYLFADGTRADRQIVLGADRFRRIVLQNEPAILARPGGTPFSVLIRASNPVVASMTHYDDFIHGGWGSLGLWSGFTAPISAF